MSITVREYQKALLAHCSKLATRMSSNESQAIAHAIDRVAAVGGAIAMLRTMIDSVSWQLAQPEETLKFGLPPIHDEDQFPITD